MWETQTEQTVQPEEYDRYFKNKQFRHHGYEEQQVLDNNRKALVAVAWVAGAIAFITLCLTIYMAVLVADIPTLEDLQNPKLNLASTAFTADGKELTRYYYDNRKWVHAESISPNVFKALVAIEDYRFYDHWGIDLVRTLSIPFHVLRGRPQGGSTISQQLARNLYEQVGRENSFGRKLKEMMTAIELERHYTKDEILELYLNTTEYLYDAHGIEAAAGTYFSKSPMELSLAESATLMGMLNNPALYNPVPYAIAVDKEGVSENSKTKYDITLNRRNLVLNQMEAHGYITPEERDAAKAEPLNIKFNRITRTSGPAPYFAEYVRQWLKEWSEGTGYDVYRDGLVIHTTLDTRIQALADSAVALQIGGLQAVADIEWSKSPKGFGTPEAYKNYRDKNGVSPFTSFWERKTDIVNSFIRQSERYREAVEDGGNPATVLESLRNNAAYMDSLKTIKTRLEVGFMAMDPRNGQIKAWVGGRDFGLDQYDHVAIAKRQPGSTFKPFVYTAAFDNGYSPSYSLQNYAKELNCEGVKWAPKNSGSMGSGAWVSLRVGLQKSLNTITAQLGCKVGSKTFVEYAIKMGADENIKPELAVPAASLGTIEVTLLEMVTAYATLANNGVRRRPIPVTRIEDRYGNVIETFQTQTKEVLNPNVAYTVTDILRGVITAGTGVRIGSTFGIREDVAGKTGTTQESSDGWFMMMYPELVMGAWVGFNDRRVTFRSSAWGQGGRTGLYVVGDFFRRGIKEGVITKDRRFQAPPNYRPPKQVAPVEYYQGPRNDQEGQGGAAPPRPAPAPPPQEERRFDW